MENIFEVILTVIVLGFWILFPIGMFLSVSHVDKNTDQIVQLNKHRHYSEVPEEVKKEKKQKDYRPVPFDWHHPIIYFRRWLQQE
ncbi:MAG: hypothetical protein ACLGHN_10815 [Bacteriovoracia bacterium]